MLWNVSMEVHLGERVAILGSNGAGKSTLIGAITGMLPPRRGDITFKGQSIVGMKPHQITQLGVAIAPEGRRVYKEMTVRENLEMGAYPMRGRGQLKQTLDHVLSIFPAIAGRTGQQGGTLSGGEQQMLAIGRPLMSRPELLLIDELSLGLAPLVTKEIFKALDELAEEVTILLVEQNVEQALKHSKRAYVLESGRMTRTDSSSKLMEDDDIRRAYLGL